MNASRLVVSSTTTPDVQNIIGRMRANLSATIASQKQALRERQRAELAWQEKVERKKRLATKRCDANLQAAVIGAQRIIAFAQMPDIQELIRIDGELRTTFPTNYTPHFLHDDSGELIFFIGSYLGAREDGFDDAHAFVVLKPNALWFVVSIYGATTSGRLVEIPYADCGGLAASLVSDEVPELFGGPIISSETRRNRLRPLELWRDGKNNREFGSFSELFGLVLIECANPEKFGAYCTTALKHLSA